MEDQVIQLDEGGTATIREVVLEGGAIRQSLAVEGVYETPPPPLLTRNDCATIAGALLGRSHAPTAT
jgi:hypothetical protein